ncbi:gag-pol polyprotein [Chaetoceros tenuissimus]|uniref:Gag-pol polyprotein n=1 Tax=Chaetoceros tenuissimus TaxID=426638 RepID=A0AAD3CNL8_9STRA|nr:gag-pol polyprotein [Chaetoceros tenuissimus]
MDSIGEHYMMKMNIATAHSANVTQDPFTDTTDDIIEIREHRCCARAKFEDEQSKEAKAWVDQTLNARKVRKFEYRVEVPRNWEDVLRIDMENDNTAWQDAIKKEIGALLVLECFDTQEEGYRPPEDYQYVRMHLVYAVKVDLRKKARLVCDGSRVNPRGLTIHATIVKGISVRLLDLIASHWNKKILTGGSNLALQAMDTSTLHFCARLSRGL